MFTNRSKFMLLIVLLVCAFLSTEVASARKRRVVAEQDLRDEPIDEDAAAAAEAAPRRYRSRSRSRRNYNEGEGEDTEGEVDAEGEGDEPQAPADDEYPYQHEDNDANTAAGRKHHFDSKDFDDKEQHPINEQDLSSDPSYTEVNTSIHNIPFEHLMQMNCGVEKLDKGTEQMVINMSSVKFPPGVTFLASIRSSNEIWSLSRTPPTPFSTNRFYYVSLNRTSGEHEIVIPNIPNNTYHELVVRPVWVKTNIGITSGDMFKTINKELRTAFGEDVFEDIVKRVIFRTGKDDEVCNKELLATYERHKKEAELKRAKNESLFHSRTAIAERYQKLIKHAELREFSSAFLTMDFRKAMLKKDFSKIMTKISKSVYKISNIFTKDFLKILESELENARQVKKEGLVSFSSPSKMHEKGFLLSELGIDHVFDVFFHNWFGNVTGTIPPFYNMCGDMLDELHGMVMEYGTGGGQGQSGAELSKHVDESEISFNLCLSNSDAKGSGMVFKGIRDDSKSPKKDEATVFIKPGEALLHVGQNWHYEAPMSKGATKTHIVMWFKSTYCRESPLQVYFNDCDGLMEYEKEKCEMGKSEL